jgi:hypothetical protein
MKSSELRKLVQEYQTLKAKQEKSYDHRIHERLREIEHRYYHETGNDLITK